MIGLYKTLELPIRQLDETRLVKRIFDGIQIEADFTEAKIVELLEQIDIETIDDDLLQYKLGQVGFTRRYKHIVDRLSAAQQRKLLRLGVPMWKTKSSGKGLVESVRFLTGADPVYNDWFYFRFILGETFIGEEQKGVDPYIIGGQVSVYDEWVSNLRMMNDGTLDKQLLVSVIQLQRLNGERVEAVVLDFLDNFRFARDRWTNVNPPEGVVTTDDEFELAPSTFEEPIITVVPLDQLEEISLLTRFRIAVAAEILIVDFYHKDINNFYRLEITSSATGTGNLRLRRFQGGSPTTLVNQATTIPLIAGTDYKLRITTENPVTGGVNVVVWLDSNKQFEVADPGSGVKYGKILYGCDPSNTGNCYIDNVEFWRRPLKWAFIKPNDEVDYSSTFWSD